MLSFETGPALARHVIYSPRGYIVPRKHGRLLAGSTSEHVGFDKRVTEEGREAILAAATEIAPAVKSLVVKDSWAGLRPRASDNLPVLGPCAEIEGVFYATGHYRNGILLAPVTGELIARAIIENEAIPNEFSPNRFSLAEVS
jgi:glycine oxidase